MCPRLPSLSIITILLITKKTHNPKTKKKNNNQNLKSQITTINNKQKIKFANPNYKPNQKQNKKVKTETLETKTETLDRERDDLRELEEL